MRINRQLFWVCSIAHCVHKPMIKMLIDICDTFKFHAYWTKKMFANLFTLFCFFHENYQIRKSMVHFICVLFVYSTFLFFFSFQMMKNDFSFIFSIQINFYIHYKKIPPFLWFQLCFLFIFFVLSMFNFILLFFFYSVCNFSF